MGKQSDGPGRPKKAAGEKAETFSVRMTPALRQWLEESAASAGRSLNGEIVWRLQGGASADAPDQAKRQAVLDALLEAVAEVLRWSEHIEADPQSEDCRRWLADAMEDLATWHSRLQKLDAQK